MTNRPRSRALGGVLTPLLVVGRPLPPGMANAVSTAGRDDGTRERFRTDYRNANTFDVRGRGTRSGGGRGATTAPGCLRASPVTDGRDSCFSI